ncbi:dihydroorotase [Stagnimonas aquatica]|uniref:Dihydroorotase n=1 Tax=Stagnimonas aquatica TaxID=2689987 RepID=A0A3N0V8B0_9GAMM|nr:dihydroorotase [Stagnimonas aquatica]ROH89047.1 dihydroorotase [Stagnimonas aquatica]
MSKSPSSLLIQNVRLLDPAGDRDTVTNLLLRDGAIAALGADALAGGDESLDAGGHWLLPAATDLAARLREPGATQKATIASEASAALAAGVATLCVPPDTKPVADTPALIDRIHAKAAQAGAARVLVLGALTQGLAGEALAELSALKAAGVVGVSNGQRPLANALVARRALEYAQGLGLTVHVQALEPALANSGCAHEGAIATRLGLAPIPVAAEVAAIRQWISLVEDTGGRVHFGRLSSARGAELVESAQQRGLPVSADVAIHQLFLTDAALEGFNAQAHLLPPLRSEDDRQALRAALARGVIGALCSDHQPHEPDAKINPFPLTEPGTSSVETLLPLALELVHEGLLTPLQMAQRLSLGPSRVLGQSLPELQPGARLPLVLVDPQSPWTLRAQDLRSRGRNSLFDGRRFQGRVLRVFP